MWVIGTKDRYVYIEFPSNLKGPWASKKDSVVEVSEAISKDKILDENLLDETISNKPLFNAFALGVSGRFVNGKNIILTQTLDMLEILSMNVGDDRSKYIVRNKDGYVYEEYSDKVGIIKGKNKIIDPKIHRDEIPEEVKYKAISHTIEAIGENENYLMLSKYGNEVDVLKTGISGASWLWMVRTKDGYVFTGNASDFKITENLEEKRAKEKDKELFLGNLENNYQKVIKLYNSKNYQGAMKEINKFITYGKDDYKDIKQLNKKITKIGKLEQKVKNLPASKIFENLNGYEELLKLDPNNELYKKKVAHYQANYEKKNKLMRKWKGGKRFQI